MTLFKSGDLVVLKSGGPIMTVDTVNTDIFDDEKITGVLCVWFVGNKLERVRFDHRAIEAADAQATASQSDSPTAAKPDLREEAAGDYGSMLDSMVGALNTISERAPTPARRRVPRRRKSAAPAEAAEPIQPMKN